MQRAVLRVFATSVRLTRCGLPTVASRTSRREDWSRIRGTDRETGTERERLCVCQREKETHAVWAATTVASRASRCANS